MKTLFTLMSTLSVLCFVAVASADCGNCCPAKTTAKKTTEAASAADGCCGSAGSACCEGASTAVATQAKASTAGTCTAGTCTAGTCTAAKGESDKGCPVAAAMEKLPEMTYAVGEKKVCCPKEAAKLAEQTKGHVHYCVGNEEFDSESDAQASLIEATEKFVATVAKPHTCPTSGKTTLAGHAQGCEKTAAHTAELMRKAMSEVKMTYAVGDKACGCPVEAKKLAEESGSEKVFVVAGEKTPCEKTARLNLARAKYRAAIQALVQAQASTSNQQESSGS